MKFIPTNVTGMMIAIVATGAILNLANSGKFGTSVKKAANFITTGYGAGPLS